MTFIAAFRSSTKLPKDFANLPGEGFVWALSFNDSTRAVPCLAKMQMACGPGLRNPEML